MGKVRQQSGQPGKVRQQSEQLGKVKQQSGRLEEGCNRLGSWKRDSNSREAGREIVIVGKLGEG
jgi:hypothetical protein